MKRRKLELSEIYRSFAGQDAGGKGMTWFDLGYSLLQGWMESQTRTTRERCYWKEMLRNNSLLQAG